MNPIQNTWGKGKENNFEAGTTKHVEKSVYPFEEQRARLFAVV